MTYNVLLKRPDGSKIIHGNALEVLKDLPSNSVDCVITSPPYWQKRTYGEECIVRWFDGWEGELGLEPTPSMYINHLIEIFREIKRVLKPHGNVFVVIDDTYNSGRHKWKPTDIEDPKWIGRNYLPLHDWHVEGIDRKSLLLIPERFAIAMVDKLGFILRNKIIWSKKVHIYKDRTTIGNAMPESVKDRLCHTYEFIYHFVKEPKYYYDLDAVRIPHKPQSYKRYEYDISACQIPGFAFPNEKRNEPFSWNLHPLGANPGDVVQINTEPFPDAHFSVFPTKLVEFLIKLGCPAQVCKKCGRPRERIVEKITINAQDKRPDRKQIGHPQKQRGGDSVVYTVGWTDCGCNAGFEPGIVLDPFLGSGTTALVALQMGRRFIGIELNRSYCEMAIKRIKPHLSQMRLDMLCSC